MPDSRDPFRIGSEAPESPVAGACDAAWTGPWEDRVEARPRCARPPGHGGEHAVERAGFDRQCVRYTWVDGGGEARAEPC